jgi:hypothetical protein
MKGRAHVVRAIPSLVHRRVGAEDMVVGQHVGVPQLGYPLGVSTDGPGVGADLGLREYHAYLHADLFTAPAGTGSARARLKSMSTT